jgi:hypothetical protein
VFTNSLWPNRDPLFDQESMPWIFSFGHVLLLLGKEAHDYNNLYVFVRNEPTSLVDKFGLMPSGRAAGQGHYGPPTGQCPCGQTMGIDWDCVDKTVGMLNGGHWGGAGEAGVGIAGGIWPGALGPAAGIVGFWAGGTYLGAMLGCNHCH